MSISDKLAGLNAARFSEWQPKFTPDNARQALLAFKGDVYTACRRRISTRPISTLPSSICVCCPVCMACCARSI